MYTISNIKSKCYPILLACLFACALFLKTPETTIETTSSTLSSQSALKNLSLLNFAEMKRIRPVNRGDFEITFFQSLKCRGMLAIMPLTRNEEGAAILAHYLKSSPRDIQYIFKGQVYSTFPAITYGLTSLNPFTKELPLFAVREYGRCNLIKNTNWSQI